MTTACVYKVLVVGDLGVGKTAIIKRYVTGNFSPEYKSTIGVDFGHREIQWNDTTRVDLQLWDIAGQERFGSATRCYYSGAVGAFIVFDIKKAKTLEVAKKWKADIDSKISLLNTEEPIPIILLANKIDLYNGETLYGGKTKEEIDQFCQENGFITWCGVSAMNNLNIEEGMDSMVGLILKRIDNISDDSSTQERNTRDVIVYPHSLDERLEDCWDALNKKRQKCCST